MTETARVNVTDKGRPYGIATTMTVRPRMKYPINYFTSFEVSQFFLTIFSIPNLNNKTHIMTTAAMSPNFPIFLAKCYNFYCNGVMVYSYCYSNALIFPIQDLYPTTKIIILPYPFKTLVPLNNIGDGTSCFPAVFF